MSTGEVLRWVGDGRGGNCWCEALWRALCKVGWLWGGGGGDECVVGCLGINMAVSHCSLKVVRGRVEG